MKFNPLTKEELAKISEFPDFRKREMKRFSIDMLLRPAISGSEHIPELRELEEEIKDMGGKRLLTPTPAIRFDQIMDDFTTKHPNKEISLVTALRNYAGAFVDWELSGRNEETAKQKDTAATAVKKTIGARQGKTLLEAADDKLGSTLEAGLNAENIRPFTYRSNRPRGS